MIFIVQSYSDATTYLNKEDAQILKEICPVDNILDKENNAYTIAYISDVKDIVELQQSFGILTIGNASNIPQYLENEVDNILMIDNHEKEI